MPTTPKKRSSALLLLWGAAVLAPNLAGCGSPESTTPEAMAAVDTLIGGRWWIDSPMVDVFVTHWMDGDRVVWSRSSDQPFPLRAHLDPDGGVTLTWPGPSQPCFVVRPSSDPDARDLWTCADAQGSSVGHLRRGAVLVLATSRAALNALPPTLSGKGTSFVGSDPAGRWAVVEVGDRMTLWKSDTNQRFDLGRGFDVGMTMGNRPDADLIEFSPDGRYVAYPRPTDEDGISSLVLFDSEKASERILEPRLAVHGEMHIASVQRFSPDGRQLVFYGNWGADSYADLVAVDVASGARVVLAAHTPPMLLQTCVWFTRSDHVVFCDFGDAMNPEEAPLQSYEFSTGARRDLGTARQVVTPPDGSYLAIARSSGEVLLFEEADWEPRTVTDRLSPHSSLACVTASPDGAWLAFADSSDALQLLDVKKRSVHVVADSPDCYAGYDIGPDRYAAPVAAAGFFLPDGRTFVHLQRAADDHLAAVSRYDLVTMQDTTTTLDGSGADLLALSPTGDFVYSALTDKAWLSRGPSLVQLPWTSPSNGFWFTRDNRYLMSFADDIGILDLVSGATVNHPARLQALPPFWVNASGVTLVSPENGPMMLYFPSGEELTLAPSGSSAPDVSPSGIAALYPSGQTLRLVRLQPGAIPRPVGQGIPLGISARYAFFFDLDGICAMPF